MFLSIRFLLKIGNAIVAQLVCHKNRFKTQVSYILKSKKMSEEKLVLTLMNLSK